ncbi:MAG: CPBP family intramembrane metalloprotease [Chloroflexota bacterium]|nr:CPBP family intramembrane metalloprotease [Chloroflexota bacterium]
MIAATSDGAFRRRTPQDAALFRYWLFVALTLALTALIGLATYRTARLLQHWRPDRNLLIMPAENVLRLTLIAACIGLGLLSGLEPEALGWVFTNWQTAMWQGIVWGGALAFVFYFATRWVHDRSGERFYSPVVLHAVVPRSRRELVGVAAAMAGVVLLEELLFRSLLLGGLAPLVPVGWLIVLAGAGFGLLHLPQGVWGIAGATVAGILLGSLWLSSGTILAPIIAHYVTNMAQIIQAMRMNEFTTPLDG